MEDTAGQSIPHVPFEEGTLESDNEEAATNEKLKPKNSSDELEAGRSSISSDTSPTLRKRLNKLAKYEQKYPELLKAYRALQVTEGLVKAFEKALADITPAASIQDVEAFQQWAHNLDAKAALSIQELRRVNNKMQVLSTESKNLKDKYENEVAELKQKISQLESETGRKTVDGDEDLVEKLRSELARLTDRIDELTIGTSILEKELAAEKAISTTRAQQIKELEQSKERSAADYRVAYADASARQDALRTELVALKVNHAQEIRKFQTTGLTNFDIAQESISKVFEETSEGTSGTSRDASQSLSKSQKKRQKKKKNIVNTNGDADPLLSEESVTTLSLTSSEDERISLSMKERDNLQIEIDTLRATTEIHATERRFYEKKIQELSEHQESTEEMRDMVKSVGNELVEARDQIKELILQRDNLDKTVTDLRQILSIADNEKVQLNDKLTTLEAFTGPVSLVSELEEESNVLKERLEDTERRLQVVTKDLEIAETLSADRFREVSTTKDNLRMMQSELNELRRQHSKMSTDKTAIEATVNSLETRSRALERAERARREELATSQKSLTAREKEIKAMQMTLKEEESKRKLEEGRSSALKSEVTKLTLLRDSIIASRNDLNGQLSTAQNQLRAANMKLSSLQQLRNQLIQERDSAQEELQMGQAKFDSSQSLMESQREQTIDMQHRLREMRDRYEAIEEEVSEAHRQLSERARESETLRRLLTELEGSQESRLREMRERMESAISERDKAEDEAAFNGKKRAREVEDLKEALLDAERALRKANLTNQDLSISLDVLTKTHETAKSITADRDRDMAELRETMNGLSQSLREAESQMSILEQDRESLRCALKESNSRLDRVGTDLKIRDDLLHRLKEEKAQILDRQNEIVPTVFRPSHQKNDSIGSIPSTPTNVRTPSMHSISLSDHRPIEKAEVDREYIKNVLFQFLENKEKRRYLLPAISKLLLLSKQQEGVFVSSLK